MIIHIKRFFASILLLLLINGISAQSEIVRFTAVDLNGTYGGSMLWVNSDGTLFGGSYYFGGGFRWTFEDGEDPIGGYNVRDMDNRGIFVGEAPFPMLIDSTISDVDAACYLTDDEWIMIGPIINAQPVYTNMFQGGWAIAADTMIIAGMHWHENTRTTAFVWSPDTTEGFLLEDNGLDCSSRPNAVNNNGTTIVGWATIDDGTIYANRAAHAWFYNRGTGSYDFEFLGALGADEGWYGGEAYGVSPNGKIIVGRSGDTEMFIWTREEGMQNMGHAPGHDPVWASVTPLAATDNGVVVGFAQPVFNEWAREAIIYSPESGIEFLKDSLENLGLEDQFQIWSFIQANDITADGNVIVGTCMGQTGILQPFILEFIPPQTPQNLQSSFINDGTSERIELSWDDIPNNEYNYTLQRRSTTGGITSDWTEIANPDSSLNSYTDYTIYGGGIEWEYRLRAQNPVGESDWASVESYVSTDNKSIIPDKFGITSIYPNPFNPATRLQFQIPDQLNVVISLYSVIGTQVAVIHDGILEAGSHDIRLDLSGYSTGMYFLRLEAAGLEDIAKITYIK